MNGAPGRVVRAQVVVGGGIQAEPILAPKAASQQSKRSVGHHPESETDSRSAVENLVDPGTHLQPIDLEMFFACHARCI